MIVGAYTFLDVFWTILVFFIWVAWFMLLFRVFGDLFRRHDIERLGQGGLGDLRDHRAVPRRLDLPDRAQRGYGRARHELRPRGQGGHGLLRPVGAGSGGAAAEIAKAKELLDSGAISQEEYERLKQRAMS